MLQIKEHSQKVTPYLFQNDVVLYFESYWKQENAADIIFLGFNKLIFEFPVGKKKKICGWLQKVNERLQLTMACD